MLKKSFQILALLTMTCSMTSVVLAEPKHGIAMRGEPALPADYPYFPYVNPDAPKGGSITYGVVGTFDSLNPFLIKSIADEPFTMYGLLAEKVETNEERTFVEFTLNPKAKWSDGQPVTPDDVIFTFNLLTEKGRPPFN
eukprot:gene27644-33404_t